MSVSSPPVGTIDGCAPPRVRMAFDLSAPALIVGRSLAGEEILMALALEPLIIIIIIDRI